MTGIIIYCVFCFLYEIGFVIASYSDIKNFAIGSIFLAPIMMPIELGGAVYCLLKNSKK